MGRTRPSCTVRRFSSLTTNRRRPIWRAPGSISRTSSLALNRCFSDDPFIWFNFIPLESGGAPVRRPWPQSQQVIHYFHLRPILRRGCFSARWGSPSTSACAGLPLLPGQPPTRACDPRGHPPPVCRVLGGLAGCHAALSRSPGAGPAPSARWRAGRSMSPTIPACSTPPFLLAYLPGRRLHLQAVRAARGNPFLAPAAVTAGYAGRRCRAGYGPRRRRQGRGRPRAAALSRRHAHRGRRTVLNPLKPGLRAHRPEGTRPGSAPDHRSQPRSFAQGQILVDCPEISGHGCHPRGPAHSPRSRPSGRRDRGGRGAPVHRVPFRRPMTSSSTHVVLLPSYNAGPRLASTAEEALRYWRPVWVVIDGSTDGSPDEIRALAAP